MSFLDKMKSKGSQGSEGLSVAQQSIAREAFMVVYYHGFNEAGLKVFAFISVPLDRLKAMMKAYKGDLFDPEEYGKVLHWGEGEPTEVDMIFLRDNYGLESCEWIDMGNAMKAHDDTKEGGSAP